MAAAGCHSALMMASEISLASSLLSPCLQQLGAAVSRPLQLCHILTRKALDGGNLHHSAQKECPPSLQAQQFPRILSGWALGNYTHDTKSSTNEDLYMLPYMSNGLLITFLKTFGSTGLLEDGGTIRWTRSGRQTKSAPVASATSFAISAKAITSISCIAMQLCEVKCDMTARQESKLRAQASVKGKGTGAGRKERSFSVLGAVGRSDLGRSRAASPKKTNNKEKLLPPRQAKAQGTTPVPNLHAGTEHGAKSTRWLVAVTC